MLSRGATVNVEADKLATKALMLKRKPTDQILPTTIAKVKLHGLADNAHLVKTIRQAYQSSETRIYLKESNK
jgi:hypothetical protein